MLTSGVSAKALIAPWRFASRSPALLPRENTAGRMGRISPVRVSTSMFGFGVSVISAPMDGQAHVVERHLDGCVGLVDSDVDPVDRGLGQADVGEALSEGLDQ